MGDRTVARENDKAKRHVASRIGLAKEVANFFARAIRVSPASLPQPAVLLVTGTTSELRDFARFTLRGEIDHQTVGGESIYKVWYHPEKRYHQSMRPRLDFCVKRGMNGEEYQFREFSIDKGWVMKFRALMHDWEKLLVVPAPPEPSANSTFVEEVLQPGKRVVRFR